MPKWRYMGIAGALPPGLHGKGTIMLIAPHPFGGVIYTRIMGDAD